MTNRDEKTELKRMAVNKTSFIISLKSQELDKKMQSLKKKISDLSYDELCVYERHLNHLIVLLDSEGAL